jgi:hypothetical protein
MQTKTEVWAAGVWKVLIAVAHILIEKSAYLKYKLFLWILMVYKICYDLIYVKDKNI